MCCSNRTHVLVISIICLVLTVISTIWYGLTTVAAFIHGVHQRSLFSSIYGGYIGVALGVQTMIYVFWITSEILSIVGAVKNNKCLLVPFMVCLALQMLFFIGFAIFVFWLAYGPGLIYVLIYIIPLLVGLGISIYFLAITIKFHMELSSGRVHGVQPGMVLQPYTVHQGGVPTNGHGYDPAYGPQGQMQKMEIP